MQIVRKIAFILALSAAQMTAVAPAMAAPVTIRYSTAEAGSGESLAAKLDSAMAQKAEKIVVVISPFTKTLPEPVAVWLKKIEQSGGEIYVRSLTMGLLIDIIGIVLPHVVTILREIVDNWLDSLGYGDPAKNYNAMIVTDKTGDGAATCFVRVEFYLRDSPAWAAERAKGKPLSEASVSTDGTPVGTTQACPAG